MGFEFGTPSTKKKPGGFMAQATSAPDPLAEVEYTGNVEADAASELDALSQGFRKRRETEANRFKQTTDSEFWFAMCFKSRAEKEAFLRAVNLAQLGDKYLDGHKAAQILGVDI